ncbi:MAG: hypothetical protein GY696_12265 [Gammaproteobacteria bacterium]|nr:hypothetical protein [Gammaproteobacteria bacterium]
MGDQPQPPPIQLPIPTIKPFRESTGEVSTDYRQWVKCFGYYLNIVESNLAPGQQLSNWQKNTNTSACIWGWKDYENSGQTPLLNVSTL